jgi:hypothetical protein
MFSGSVRSGWAKHQVNENTLFGEKQINDSGKNDNHELNYPDPEPCGLLQSPAIHLRQTSPLVEALKPFSEFELSSQSAQEKSGDCLVAQTIF